MTISTSSPRPSISESPSPGLHPGYRSSLPQTPPQREGASLSGGGGNQSGGNGFGTAPRQGQDATRTDGVGRDGDHRIALRLGERRYALDLQDVAWVEGARNYVRLHTGNGTHLHRITLIELEKILPPTFVRIHRSIIVNTRHIREVQRRTRGVWSVVLQNGASLDVARRNRHCVQDLLPAR